MKFAPSNLRMAIYIAVLNLIDAAATWWLVTSASHPLMQFVEANPIMAWLMQIDPLMIFVAKFVLIGLMLPLLVMTANRRYLVARYGLILLTLTYFALVCWQSYLVYLALTPV